MAYKFFDKKIGPRVGSSVNEELAQEFHKPMIKKFNKNNIWAADLAEMGLLSSRNRGVKYLLCEINAFTKYAWIKGLKV